MSKVSDNAHYALAGFGLYCALRWIFLWYPTAIVGLFICQSTDPYWGESIALISGVIFMLVVYIFLQVLIQIEKYEVVIFCYVITAWPFIHQVYTYIDRIDKNIDVFPLAPIDWIPFL